MTDHYAEFAAYTRKLDKSYSRISGRVRRRALTRRPAQPAKREPMRDADRHHGEADRGFRPRRACEVEDESHQHAGHAGHRPGGQTHFRVYIVSEAFRGKSRIDRHRMINQTLARELAEGVHALAIHASAPGEGEASRPWRSKRRPDAQ